MSESAPRFAAPERPGLKPSSSFSPAVNEIPFDAPASSSSACRWTATPQSAGSFGSEPLRLSPAAWISSGIHSSGATSSVPPFGVRTFASARPISTSPGVFAPSEFEIVTVRFAPRTGSPLSTSVGMPSVPGQPAP